MTNLAKHLTVADLDDILGWHEEAHKYPPYFTDILLERYESLYDKICTIRQNIIDNDRGQEDD